MDIYQKGFVFTNCKDKKGRTRDCWFSYDNKYPLSGSHNFIDGEDVTGRYELECEHGKHCYLKGTHEHSYYAISPSPSSSPSKGEAVGVPHHPVMIKCTECNTVQGAIVEHTVPFGTYIHHCVKCGYTIMESEWVEVKPYEVGAEGKSAGRELTSFGEAIERAKAKFPVTEKHIFTEEYLRNNKNADNYELRCAHDAHRIAQEEKQSIFIDAFLQATTLYKTQASGKPHLSQAQQKSLMLLDKFLKEQPEEAKRIMKEVEAMGFEGPTVEEYFKSVGYQPSGKAVSEGGEDTALSDAVCFTG